VLSTANGVVQLPPPAWDVIPDPVNPQAPPQVVADIEAPNPPPQWEFGDALWVKVFTTEFEDPDLEELVGDNPNIEQAETEIEWQLLQKDFNNPQSGRLESGYGVPVGPDAASIVRRYEFYEFSGRYDEETHEAQFDPPYGDSHPGPTDVGTYLGSQNVVANLLVPEPAAIALAWFAFTALVLGARTKRRH
jgi:hypothetical protein